MFRLFSRENGRKFLSSQFLLQERVAFFFLGKLVKDLAFAPHDVIESQKQLFNLGTDFL